MAQKLLHLWRRGNVYYLRMRVPTDIKDAVGKEFIVQSLKSSDRKEAIRRLQIAQGEVQKLFDVARNQQRVPSRVDRLLSRGEIAKLSTAELEGIVRQWFGRELEKARQFSDLPTDPEALETILEDNEEAFERLRAHDPGQYADAVSYTTNRLLVEAGVPTATPNSGIVPKLSSLHPVATDGPSSQFRELKALVRRGELILNRVRRAQIVADTSIPSDPVLTPTHKAPVAYQGIALNQLIKEFENDPSRPSMTDKTRSDYGMVFRILREVIGSDTPVRSITRREHCLPVRELLQRLPPNATKKFPGKSVEFAADQREKHNLPKLNPQTINSHLNKMSTLFNWAVKEDLMDKNPAVGLSIEIEPHEDDDGRRSFTRDELKAIFNTPLYTGCRDDERNFSKPGPNRPRRSRFWVPLIALFAGMRQNEICQLLPSDIDEIAGIPVIRVQKTKSWQKLKSRQARRVVPIHPELIRIGFIDYARDVQAAGAPLLFHDLTLGPRGYMAASFQKRFATFLRSVGIADGDATFHSFRHTWRDALRQARVPEERVQAVGGWSGVGQDKRYGDWFESPELVETIAGEISKVNYRGLSLDHLVG